MVKKKRILGEATIGFELKCGNLCCETDDGIDCPEIYVENTEKMDVQPQDQVVEIKFKSIAGEVNCYVTLETLRKILATAERDVSKTVWVVFKRGVEGASFYAICQSAKIAEKARTKLAAVLGETETHFEIQEVAANAVHPFGMLCQDGSVDIDEDIE